MDRTESDLRVANRRFRIALRASAVTVYEQDQDLAYTWIYNVGLKLKSSDVLGRTETDFATPDSAREVQAMKQAALDAGEARSGEFATTKDGVTQWFSVRVEPVTLSDGRPGLIGASTDIERGASGA